MTDVMHMHQAPPPQLHHDAPGAPMAPMTAHVPQAPGTPGSPSRQVAAKLFVGQVPAVCTEDMLRPLFAPYGDISEIKIMRDLNTGRSKGCAWVRYASVEMGQCAIDALHGKHCIPPQTNTLQVRFAEARPGQSPNMNGGGGGNSLTGMPTSPAQLPAPARPLPVDPNAQSNTVFIGNLPPECSADSLRAFLAQRIGPSSLADVSVPRGKQFGFLTFHQPMDAVNAHRALAGADYNGHVIRVELARARPPPQYAPAMAGMPMAFQPHMAPAAPAYPQQSYGFY